jgi:GTPase
LKTTIAGLTGSHPDYAIVIINSLAGVTKMTREHLGVVLALEIPLICVVSKVDMAPLPVLEQSKKQLFRILKSSAANRMPIQSQ